MNLYEEYSSRLIGCNGFGSWLVLGGYIIWRRGTGDNVELLHIKTVEKGKGFGRRLFYDMLTGLTLDPPYYSIFGFTRTSNEDAQAFYGALGFNLQSIEGLYKDGTAVMFWQSYEKLVEEMNVYVG